MTTYYTSSTALGGGVGSYADPFTLQEAFDTATAGDEVRVLNDGTYYPTTTIDVDTNQGTGTSPIVFVGRNSADTYDEVTTISGTSLTSGSILNFDFGNSSHSYVYIKKLKFDGSPANTDMISATAFNSRGIYWFDCIFTNSSRYAYGNGSWQSTMIRCQFINNANRALISWNDGVLIGCYFESSSSGTTTANGIFNTKSEFYNCVFRNNGHIQTPSVYVNCTFDGNNSIGKAIAGGVGSLTRLINCVFCNYTVRAIDAGSTEETHRIQGCYFYNNTSDTDLTIDPNTNTLNGADPQFTNTTNGTEDYTPQTGSPLIGAGQPSLIPNSTASDMTSKPTIGAITAAIAAAATSVYSYVANFTRLG